MKKIYVNNTVKMKKIYVNDSDLNYSYIVIDPNKVQPYQPYQDDKYDEKRDETIDLLKNTNENKLEAKGVQQGFEIIDTEAGYLGFVGVDHIVKVIQ